MPLLLLICCWLALAPAMAQDGVDPAALRATLHQELLPALGARTQAAQARAAAAERWFSGAGAWTEAFPVLTGAPVGDPAYLRAHSWQLQERAEARAAEQAEPQPDGLAGGAPDLIEAWREALTAACEAEERADVFEQRFVAGLRAALDRAPLLRDGEVQPQLEAWAAVRSAAQVAEPTPEQLASAVAAGQATRDLVQLRLLAWRAATVPGDPALGLAVEQQLEPVTAAVPASPATALAVDARVDRLGRVAPLLRDDLAARVQALTAEHERLELVAEKLRLEGVLQADESADEALDELSSDQLEEQVRQLHVTLERARHDLGAELHDAGQDGLRQEIAQLRVWIDEKRLSARQAALDRTRRLAITGLGTEQDEAVVAAVRREADLAREQADQEAELASQAEESLHERYAQLRLEIAELVEEESARRQAAVAGIEALGGELASHSDNLVAALSLPPLDPARQVRIDEAYLGLRAVVDRLRVELGVRVDVHAALRADAADRQQNVEEQAIDVDEALVTSTLRTALNETLAARADLDAVLFAREGAAAAEVDAVLSLLHRARGQRRIARNEASASARREVSRTFLPELVAELSELPVRVGATARHAGPWLRSLPSKLLDLGAIWVLLAGSVELLLLALVWLWLRRAAPSWVEQAVLRAHASGLDSDARGLPRWLWQQAQRWLEPGELDRLVAPWSAVALATVDVLASWQLARFLADAPTAISLVAWVFAAVVLWRALPTVVPALAATPKEDRPALRIISTGARDRLVWSLRSVAAWWLLLVLSRRVTLRLLDADRLLELVGVVGSLAFWVVVLINLHRWSPALVRALGERPDSRLVRWAARDSSSWVLTTLHGATALGMLVAQQTGRWATRVGGAGPRLSWLAAVVARRQLRDRPERAGEPVPEPVRRKLEALRPPLPGVELVRTELGDALTNWLEHPRRGLHVVTADRGMGRSDLLMRLRRGLSGDRKVMMAELNHRIDTPEAARGWLGRAVLGRDASANPSWQELVDEISLLPGPRVMLVDNMERMFLREVGGFRALRAVLQVMHATSDEHFWVCSFHGPTWSYLRGVPGVFDPAFFERVHPLPSAGPEALGRWLGTAAQQAGLELCFDDLAGIGPDTLEADRLRSRARAAYWRLLADSSAGNPLVARQHWLAGAFLDDTTLRMGLFDAPAVAQLQDLNDNELFVLTAVVVHDQLAVNQLARVLNLHRSGIRTACQRLVTRGILVSEGFEDSSLYRLELPWIPAVERHLRNKNFLAAR